MAFLENGGGSGGGGGGWGHRSKHTPIGNMQGKSPFHGDATAAGCFLTGGLGWVGCVASTVLKRPLPLPSWTDLAVHPRVPVLDLERHAP